MRRLETDEQLAETIREASELEQTDGDIDARARLADLKAAIADYDRRHGDEMTRAKPAGDS